MNNFINKIIAGIAVKADSFVETAKNKLKDNSANWVEEAIKYIGAVVIGLIFIGALIALFKTEILTGLKNKIVEIFNLSFKKE